MTKRRQTYRNLKPLNEAKGIFFARFKNLLMGLEVVPVRQSLGRLLVEPVKALRSVPAYNAAAMDLSLIHI